MVHAGSVFAAGIHPSRTWTSGSLESVRWNACVLVCLFVGCFTSHQHASVSEGRICSDKFTCYRTEIEVVDYALGLYSHPKEFLGNGVRTHVNSKGKIPSTVPMFKTVSDERKSRFIPTSVKILKNIFEFLEECDGCMRVSLMWRKLCLFACLLFICFAQQLNIDNRLQNSKRKPKKMHI